MQMESISLLCRENLFIWDNTCSPRRDPGSAQARSRLAGKMFCHVNACAILCSKAISA